MIDDDDSAPECFLDPANDSAEEVIKHHQVWLRDWDGKHTNDNEAARDRGLLIHLLHFSAEEHRKLLLEKATYVTTKRQLQLSIAERDEQIAKLKLELTKACRKLERAQLDQHAGAKAATARARRN